MQMPRTRTRKPRRSQAKADQDLHGNAPDRSATVLLLVDVLNDLSFPNNQKLVRQSAALARAIARLKKRCKQVGIPVIYVNDNYGKWRSDVSALLRHCLRRGAPGRQMVKRLVPQADDYIVLKPKHSAFYATPLDTLLGYIGVRTAIVAGITTNACVMISASDLYVRDLELFVPSDCVAALTDRDQRTSLDLMRKNLAADTTPSEQLDLRAFQKSRNWPAARPHDLRPATGGDSSTPPRGQSLFL